MSSARHMMAGLLLVAVSAAAAALLARTFARDDLELTLIHRPLFAAEPELSIDARGAGQLAWLPTPVATTASGVALPPTTANDDGPGGMRRFRASARFGARAPMVIDVPQVVGPFQDVSALPCAVRVTVPPAFIDDGVATTAAATAGTRPATVAAMVHYLLEKELSGQAFWPLGEVVSIGRVTIELGDGTSSGADLDKLAAVAAARVNAPADVGSLGVRVTIALGRARIPIRVAVVPYPSDGQLAFAIELRAEIDFDYRVLNWAADLAGADKQLTKIIRKAFDEAIGTVLAPPPALAFGAHSIDLVYCEQDPVRIRADTGISVRFAVPFTQGKSAQAPVQIDGDLAPTPASGSTSPAAVETSIDVNLDALNALLYEGWRTGTLDRELAAAKIVDAFNDHPLVQSLLSVRALALELELPPILGRGVSKDTLEVAVASTVQLGDDGRRTTGRLVGAATIAARTPQFSGSAESLLEVEVAHASFSCEREVSRWRPCYSLITSAALDNASAIGDAISAALSSWLRELFVDQRILVTPGDDALSIADIRIAIIDEPATAGPRSGQPPATAPTPQTVVRFQITPRLAPAAGSPVP